MASFRYEMNFGDANAGGTPTFEYFVRQDTGAALTQPTIHEASWAHGAYYFDVDWSTTTATTISWKATLAGIEEADVISSPGLVLPGTSTASGGVSSLNGYDTVQTIINRVAVQSGIAQGPAASLGDPFASTNPYFGQLIDLLTSLGDDLNNNHEWSQFIRECTITTAGSAGSYALPADFHEMLDQSGWNRSMRLPLVGPLSGQETQFLKSRLGQVIINVAFRLQGNLLVFPVPPADGQTIVFEYVSDFWIQSAASGTGPDLDHPTIGTDTVLYDPELMVAGLKLKFAEDRGFDTTKLEERFAQKLEHAIGKNVGARTIDPGGHSLTADRLLDGANVPVTGLGS